MGLYEFHIGREEVVGWGIAVGVSQNGLQVTDELHEVWILDPEPSGFYVSVKKFVRNSLLYSTHWEDGFE